MSGLLTLSLIEPEAFCRYCLPCAVVLDSLVLYIIHTHRKLADNAGYTPKLGLAYGLAPLAPCLAYFGPKNPSGYCMLESDCIYINLVVIFFASLVIIDSIFFPLAQLRDEGKFCKNYLFNSHIGYFFSSKIQFLISLRSLYFLYLYNFRNII